ncbi:bacteriocin immunity protein [Lactobacillus sp. ESL0679]|uniref:bacteriocin immunity protein n=1 Tax=Lactobacillus sp. ESL0679 TaxID=2983209 RepID=UPI0023F80F22|nr:bacteriocin immunity protein [Lactobacillus sp. ESL0679]MDF7682399.1 bacteriocin immunity protein [Lactobacillus sp. ESL0679]
MSTKKAAANLLNIVNASLNSNLSNNEYNIIILAKKRLKKQEYLPSVANSVKSSLTLLAIKQQLSPAGRKLYRKLLSPEFSDYQLGYGITQIFH